MGTWKEYFEVVGVLLGLYVFARVIFWLETERQFNLGDEVSRLLSRWQNRGEPTDYKHQPIETAELKERLKTVREDLSSVRISSRTGLSTRSARLKTKREEVLKRSFFNKPQVEPESAESSEHDGNSHGVMLI